MAQSYTRQSSFADGDTITAALFNNEYNQLVNAFSYSSTNEATTGHRHDGSAGEGGNIPQIGDLDFLNKIVVDSTNNRWGFYVEVSSVAVEQLRLQDGALIPVTDSDVDLGTSSLYFKDAYIDTVTTTGNVSIGGNLTVTGNATISGNLTFGDADTDSINLAAEIDSDIIPNTDGTYDLGSATKEWQDLYIDGTANIDSLVADTADINGGTIDGATIATSDITVGAGKTLDVSAGTLTLADDQISGDKVEGGTIAATTITTLTSTTGNITNVNATTVDSTNLEVTNLKAKDGTSAGSIADSTGVVTLASSVLTTTDINGGTIDGVTIGGTTAGAVTFTDLSDGTITITAFVDEDDMTSNSATLVPTQQSVKAYVDSQVTAQDLDITTDSGTIAIDLDSETLTVTGGTGLDSSATGNAVTLAIDSTVATLTGTQTLTNKTLTSPVISSISNTGTLTLPTSTDTLVGRATTDTLTNKTLTSPVINTSVSGTAFLDDDTFATASATTLASSESIKAYVDTTVAATNEVVEDSTPQLGGDLDTNGNDILFADNDKAIFGAGSDLQIYHDGSNSYIKENGTGALNIAGQGNINFTNSAGDETYAQFTSNSSVKLYHDNSIKLTTSSTGINITGTVTATDLLIDTDVIVTDSTNDRVGINNASPSTTLDVGGSIYFSSILRATGDGSAAAPSIQPGNDGDTGLFRPTTNTIGFSTGGTEQMRLTSTGLGIGTTSPSVALEISDSTNNAILRLTRNDTIITVGNQIGALEFAGADTDDAGVSAKIIAEAESGAGQTALAMYTGTPSALSERLRIDKDGNVGIGTTSPIRALDVRGGTTDIVANFESSDAGGYIALQDNSTSSDTAVLVGAIGDALRIDTGDTESLRIDSSGKVGIGTSSPSTTLHLSGTTGTSLRITDNFPTIQLQDASETNKNFQIRVDGQLLRFQTQNDAFSSASEKMVIDSSGNVGIGTTSPDALLEVAGTTNDALFNLTGAGTNFELRATSGNGATANSSVYRLALDYLNGTYTNSFIDFYRGSAGNNGYLAFGSSGSEAMRIDSSGNVGIGTDSPSFVTGSGLEIQRTTADATLRLEHTGANAFELTTESGQVTYNSVSSKPHVFEIGSSPKMTLDASGNVGIGTTSPSELLALQSSSGNTQIRMQPSATGTSGMINTTSGSTKGMVQYNHSSDYMRIYTNGSERMRIDSSGNVGIGTSSPNSKLDVAGNIGSSGTISSTSILNCNGSGSADSQVNIGIGRNANGYAFLDLIGDTTYTDYGLRIIRNNSGANTTSVIQHRGTGTLGLLTQEAADIRFSTNNAEAMRIDSSGNVGIGASSPDSLLHLSGGSAEKIIIEDSSNPRGNYIGIEGSDNLIIAADEDNLGSSSKIQFRVDADEKMVILNNGNVGIGATSPSKILHLAASSPVIRLEDSEGGYGEISGSNGNIRLRTDQGNTQSSSFVSFEVDTAEEMRLTSTGLGIKTTSPQESIHTTGNIRLGDSAPAEIYTNSSELRLGVDRNNDNSTSDITFYTNNNEKVRIDADGNLLVGTTSLGDVNNIVNGHLFEAANSTAGEGAVGVYNNTGTANCPALLVLNRDTSTDSTNRFVQFYADVTSSGATAMGGIVGNGASNVQFATLSDEREKENITPVDNVLDKLMNLNVVSFDWKKNDEHVKAGFIAQNVEKHFPEYVIENIANDGEEPRKGTTGGMSAGYIAVLTKAIQEQQTQIEALQSEINLLKGE